MCWARVGEERRGRDSVVKIGVLVSGGGTNLQALLDAQKRGEIPDGEISAGDRPAGQRPTPWNGRQMAGIPALALPRKDYATTADYDAALLDGLAGAPEWSWWCWQASSACWGEKMLRGYPERIVNVHPSLIPAFCGDGLLWPPGPRGGAPDGE